MLQFMRIVGNSVQCVTENIDKEFPLENFMASIEANMSIESGMLPRNCLYIKRSGQRFVYLVEIPSQLVNCSFISGSEKIRVRISIPFTQFYIAGNPISGAIGNIYMSCTKSPLISLTQKVFTVPYLNMYSRGEGKVCTGSMSIPSDISVDRKINAIVSGFFEANFNSDLNPGSPAGWEYSNAKQYMLLWQEKTKENRLLMTSDEVVLRENPRTPETILQMLAGGE